MEIAFKEGDHVKAGDFLAEVDPRPYEVALAQVEGQLRHDQAGLRAAESDLRRYRTLAAQDSISKQTSENQEYLVEQHRSTIAIDPRRYIAQKLPTPGRTSPQQSS
jgi:multidrug efflux system membrane fusion protein